MQPKQCIAIIDSIKAYAKQNPTEAQLGRGSIKSHVRTVKVLGMGLFAFQERVHRWKGVTH